MRFYVILGIAITLIVLINLYVYAHLRRVLGPKRRPWAYAFLLVLGAGIAANVFGRVEAHSVWRGWTNSLSVFGLGVELGVVIAMVFLLVVDAARAIDRLGQWIAGKITHAESNPKSVPVPASASASESEVVGGAARSERSERARSFAGDPRTSLPHAKEPLGRGSSSLPRLTSSASYSESVSVSVSESVSESESESESASESASESVTESASESASVSLSRRAFIENTASLSALALGATAGGYSVLFGRHDYAIETVPVHIPGLSPALDGYTIVQLSDLHFGPFVTEPELRAAVDRVQRARPDLVVLTGDLIDHDLSYVDFLGQLIRQLKPFARDGVAVIPGNHDYYTGINEVLRTATRAGANVLLNGGRVIGQGAHAFALLGVDDLWARRLAPGRGPQLDHAIATVPRDLPRILLSHNPAFFPDAAGKVALQLSGHTHGGQLNVGLSLTSHLMPYGYIAGMYEREGSRLYVNRGFGTAGPPARLGSSPEITRLVLTSRA